MNLRQRGELYRRCPRSGSLDSSDHMHRMGSSYSFHDSFGLFGYRPACYIRLLVGTTLVVLLAHSFERSRQALTRHAGHKHIVAPHAAHRHTAERSTHDSTIQHPTRSARVTVSRTPPR